VHCGESSRNECDGIFGNDRSAGSETGKVK
jgi:hypothetical protein